MLALTISCVDVKLPSLDSTYLKASTAPCVSPTYIMLNQRPSLLLCGIVAASCVASGAVHAFGLLPKSTTKTSVISHQQAFSRGSKGMRSQWCRRPNQGASRSVAMQLNPREEDTDFEMTVDWDEELRKLNAGELDEKLEIRDREMQELQRKASEGDPADWVKANARKAQRAAQESTYQMRGALRKAPRWQQLSRDWRFWVGAVAALSLILSIISASGRSEDLLVMHGADALDTVGQGADGGDGVAMDSYAYVALLAHATAQATGEAASQLVESGAAMVFA